MGLRWVYWASAFFEGRLYRFSDFENRFIESDTLNTCLYKSTIFRSSCIKMSVSVNRFFDMVRHKLHIK